MQTGLTGNKYGQQRCAGCGCLLDEGTTLHHASFIPPSVMCHHLYHMHVHACMCYVRIYTHVQCVHDPFTACTAHTACLRVYASVVYWQCPVLLCWQRYPERAAVLAHQLYLSFCEHLPDAVAPFQRVAEVSPQFVCQMCLAFTKTYPIYNGKLLSHHIAAAILIIVIQIPSKTKYCYCYYTLYCLN